MLAGQTFPAVNLEEIPMVKELGIMISILLSDPSLLRPHTQRHLSLLLLM